MTASIIDWQPDTEPLGLAVVAIGVFDGVHLGHQALLRDTVADASARGVQAVAVTFDRDPDQIVSPDTAAPQLLTLADKLAAISRAGVDAILVVPFTPQLAQLAPEAFLDSMLLAALDPVAVHVGSDFRFGKKAAGDVSTLQRVGAAHGFDVTPHALVTDEGTPITSTRIRGLVAAGRISAATRLLGGHACVAGIIHGGRGEGLALGFPTANVVPVEFAALPGDGVYAGRAILADGSKWPSAISVGTPPMFPEAKDYLEAHLIGFRGDLYGQIITLEFWERLRDLRRYESLDALRAAIAADVERTLVVTRDVGLAQPTEADSAILEAAEKAARGYREPRQGAATGEDWVAVLADMHFDKHRLADIDGALESAGIVHVWEPYAPEKAPLLRLGIWDTERFSVLVQESQLDAARTLLASLGDDAPRR